jgi:vancomycin resistance protein YoaR
VSIQDEKFLNALERGIFEGQRQYEVPVVVDEPELTTAEAERLKPTELLATYDTNYLTYDDSPGRVENLEIASEAVNGTFLAPGEVFSFNALAEPLQYHDTKVIVGGRVDTAEGGGLCQVSSTLYMAANYAGLDVIERHPHYAELPYIRPGFDATVWFGALDMKFKNTSPGYLLIQQWVDESTGTVNAAIYGRPTGIEVDMRSEKVAEYTDSEGNPVTDWVTYQTVTQNGEVIFDDVLHEDTYKYLKPQRRSG